MELIILIVFHCEDILLTHSEKCTIIIMDCTLCMLMENLSAYLLPELDIAGNFLKQILVKLKFDICILFLKKIFKRSIAIKFDREEKFNCLNHRPAQKVGQVLDCCVV